MTYIVTDKSNRIIFIGDQYEHIRTDDDQIKFTVQHNDGANSAAFVSTDDRSNVYEYEHEPSAEVYDEPKAYFFDNGEIRKDPNWIGLVDGLPLSEYVQRQSAKIDYIAVMTDTEIASDL